MGTRATSEAVDDYLKIIFTLTREGGPAATGEIAAHERPTVDSLKRQCVDRYTRPPWILTLKTTLRSRTGSPFGADMSRAGITMRPVRCSILLGFHARS